MKYLIVIPAYNEERYILNNPREHASVCTLLKLSKGVRWWQMPLDLIYKIWLFVYIIIRRDPPMRTLIDIDETLLKKAIALTHASTKKEVVRLAMEELIHSRLRQKLKEMAGSGAIDMTLEKLKMIRRKN